jgi:hypothetical protein
MDRSQTRKQIICSPTFESCQDSPTSGLFLMTADVWRYNEPHHLDTSPTSCPGSSFVRRFTSLSSHNLCLTSKDDVCSYDYQHWLGGWLPQDHRLLQAWLDERIAHVTQPSHAGRAVSSVIQEFQILIEMALQMWMGFHQMFEQVPTKSPYDPPYLPIIIRQVRDYMTLRCLSRSESSPKHQSTKAAIRVWSASLSTPFLIGRWGGLTTYLNPVMNAQSERCLMSGRTSSIPRHPATQVWR